MYESLSAEQQCLTVGQRLPTKFNPAATAGSFQMIQTKQQELEKA
jgi:hypothetical protein